MKVLYTLCGSLLLVLLLTGCSGENQGLADTGSPTTAPDESARRQTGGENSTSRTGPRTVETPEEASAEASTEKEPGKSAQDKASGAGAPATPNVAGKTSAPGNTSTLTTPERAAQPTFVASPEESGGIPGAADSIRDVRFGEHEGYERVVLDFGSESAAAERVPAWTLSNPTGEGYARIYLPEVFSTATTSGDFGGSLVDDYYVVSSPNGGLFVDVYATGAFEYRVLELSGPGRLAVDFRPADVSLDFPLPAAGGNTVLMSPRPGETIESPLSVSGYSRNFEAANTIRLLDDSGEVLAEETVLANGWAETWGYFETSVPFPGFSGTGTLQVGSASARDGSFEGVEIPVSASFGGG